MNTVVQTSNVLVNYGAVMETKTVLMEATKKIVLLLRQVHLAVTMNFSVELKINVFQKAIIVMGNAIVRMPVTNLDAVIIKSIKNFFFNNNQQIKIDHY